MSTIKQLPVFAGDRYVADLSVLDDGLYRFAYHLDIAPEDAVSLALPLSEPVVETQLLPPPLAQHLPEGVLREYLLGALRKSRARQVHDAGLSDDMELLEHLGGALLGRVRVGRPQCTAEMPALDREEALSAMDGSSARTFLDACFRLYASRSGLAGVQPKVLASGVPQERLTLQTEDVILKFEPAEYPGLAVNEYFCLMAARLAGLSTVEAELSADGRRLLVRRFDRSDGGALGHEDFCALRFLPPYAKYNGDYSDLLPVIDRMISPELRLSARRELFTSVALSMVVENGDAHLKNFGVIYSDPSSTVRLAPVYDVVCTTVYQPQDLPALSVLGEKRWPDREVMMRLGRAMGLRQREVIECVSHVIEGVQKTAAAMQEYVREHPERLELADRLVTRWRCSLNRIGASTVLLWPESEESAEAGPGPG